jgi:hypothetical protein
MTIYSIEISIRTLLQRELNSSNCGIFGEYKKKSRKRAFACIRTTECRRYAGLKIFGIKAIYLDSSQKLIRLPVLI